MLSLIQRAYSPLRNPQRATQMSKYMQNLFPFLGIPTPQRRALNAQLWREVLQVIGHSPPTHEELDGFMRVCWDQKEREYHYFALEFARAPVNEPVVSQLSFLQHTTRSLLSHKPWWDTVDPISSHLVGGAVRSNRAEGELVMAAWVEDPNMWLRRAALLHQLKYKQHTNDKLLFAFCTSQAEEPNFFIRKAIGWSLRAYSCLLYTSPSPRDRTRSRMPSSA
eukprot:TRINITY_DN8694_c0_g1_i2.p1 TRINITY_DN8694_c0_g1~~TRINITY_DN8694_c0_g1_i2.p1  ORF type:complete len:222 (-),score=34.79 TRINITY_DN8694_c0_g1_i2:82-747(-)